MCCKVMNGSGRKDKYKVCILCFSYMWELAKTVISELDHTDTNYDLYEADLLNQDEVVQTVLKEGTQVFVTGGGSAARFKRNYSLPLIEFRVRDIDYMVAIQHAKQLGYSKIGVVYHKDATVVPRLSMYEQLSETMVCPIVFDDVSDLKESIEKTDCEVVIGAAATIDLAITLNKPYVRLYAGEETIREACLRARDLAIQLSETKRNKQIFKSVLYTAQLGIVITDKDGKIEFMNKTMEKYIQASAQDLQSMSVEELFPNLPYKKLMENEACSNDSYHLIANTMMRCVMEKIVVYGKNSGVIMSFHPNPHNLRRKGKNIKNPFPVYKLKNITAYSNSMKGLVDSCHNIIPVEDHTMILGEIGTAREEIAMCLHNASHRADKTCITIDLALVDDDNANKIFYGYIEKGCRIDGLLVDANGGSVILKNIEMASLRVQAILSNAIYHKQIFLPGMALPDIFDIVFYTVALPEEEQKIRPDLRQALSINQLQIPVLRQRIEDIVPLFMKYLLSLTKSKKIQSVTEKMERLLVTYTWPGNVTELRTVSIKYVKILEQSSYRTADWRYECLIKSIGEKNIVEAVKCMYPYSDGAKSENNAQLRKRIEKFKELLGYTNEKTADLLAVSRTTVWRIMKK